MSPEETRALWGRFLAGEELLLDDQRRLVEALEADPALRAELLDDAELDGVLRSIGAGRRGGEAFVQTLAGSVDRERDATRFVKKVEGRLAEPAPARETPRAFAIRSASRRYLRSRPAGGAGWKAGLAAAAAFLMILLVAAALSKPGPAKPRNDAAKTPAPRRAPESPKAPLPDRGYVERLEALRIAEQEQEGLALLPSAPEESPEERRRRIAEAEERKRRIEAEILRYVEDTARVVEPARPEAEPAAPPPATVPDAAVALEAPLIESTRGAVYVGRHRTRPQVKKDVLAPGQELVSVGAQSRAVLRYADGTRVEIAGSATIREDSDARARRIAVAHGTIASDVAPQPADRPMLFTTPHAEARILGTSIRLAAGKAETTLEVTKGRVALTRLADGATAEVAAGHFAIASANLPMEARKSLPETVTVNFGPAETRLPPGVLNDAGEPYDAARGYGWDGPRSGELIPDAFWRNPGTGVNEPRRKGRMVCLRDRARAGEDPLRSTDIVAGWYGHAETWRMPLPNGRYLVTVCVGDATWEQGPHRVTLEGNDVWPVPERTKPRPAGKAFLEKTILVDVADGELTMAVGDLPATVRKSSDGSVDTIINFIRVERVGGRQSK